MLEDEWPPPLGAEEEGAAALGVLIGAGGGE